MLLGRIAVRAVDLRVSHPFVSFIVFDRVAGDAAGIQPGHR